MAAFVSPQLSLLTAVCMWSALPQAKDDERGRLVALSSKTVIVGWYFCEYSHRLIHATLPP